MPLPPDPATDLPPEAAQRLGRASWSSGLTVPDFAACLHMGMRPVGLVQGFCVMQWSWYGAGSAYMAQPGYYGRSTWGTTIQNYHCPHGIVGGDHRSWGENFEQPWVTKAWTEGFGTAYQRMVEEAAAAGAHGVIGVVDTTSHLIDNGIREFHIYGTAVVLEGAAAPPAIWTTYLAGQRLAKLLEAGLMPVAVVASMASVRIWPVCVTEILLDGGYDSWGVVQPGGDVDQVADAQMDARRLARDHLKYQLVQDALHGATMEVTERELGGGDGEVNCTLRGTRVHRYQDVEPLPAPLPTVRLG
jgi:uncharacterized protein YbjQ (UPF0145 family)